MDYAESLSFKMILYGKDEELGDFDDGIVGSGLLG